MSLNINPTRRKKINLFDCEEGAEIRRALHQLELDDHYNTQAGQTPNLDNYPDGLIPFTDVHLLYLNRNPQVNPEHYLSNLRLRLRIR